MNAGLLPSQDDRFAETVGDAALVALLQTKPEGEQIPSSVWWLIAETLRTSVSLRRAVQFGLPADGTSAAEAIEMMVNEARLLTEAALDELAQTTGARPTAIVVPAEPSKVRPAFGLQLSILFLARMLVSHSITQPERLANTLAAHLRALDSAEGPQPAD
jgi:hypothetical protein